MSQNPPRVSDVTLMMLIGESYEVLRGIFGMKCDTYLIYAAQASGCGVATSGVGVEFSG
jgi:hypothetical protein